MKVLVTGASGFIANHLVRFLLQNSHEVIATSRSPEGVKDRRWFSEVAYIPHDLRDDPAALSGQCGEIDAVVHLAWKGLEDYQSLVHLEHVIDNYRFLRHLVESGVSRLLVTGTCQEYGLQNGCLSENMVAKPTTPYAISKDTLRRFLECLQLHHEYDLIWTRLFYIYGEGQRPQSLPAQLDRAIDLGQDVFNMSEGEQLRDYMPVEEVAAKLVGLIEASKANGIVNVCSGNPISVRKFVESRIRQQGAHIRLNLGFYPYPEHEPMAFWGGTDKLNKILEE